MNQNTGTHGLMHSYQSACASKASSSTILLANGYSITHKKTTYGQAKKNGSAAMGKVFPESGCKAQCIEKQLDNYHNQCGIDDDTPIKAVETGGIKEAEFKQAVVERAKRIKLMVKASGK